MAELWQAAVLARDGMAGHELVAFLSLQGLVGQHAELFAFGLVQIEHLVRFGIGDNDAKFHMVKDLAFDDDVVIAVGDGTVHRFFRMMHAVDQEAQQAVDAAHFGAVYQGVVHQELAGMAFELRDGMEVLRDRQEGLLDGVVLLPLVDHEEAAVADAGDTAVSWQVLL